MRIDILTLFPAMFEGPLNASILGRAREAELVEALQGSAFRALKISQEDA